MKCHVPKGLLLRINVSTLAVEWIEIISLAPISTPLVVSTLAVEWIEITKNVTEEIKQVVSTLAVEWIEIGQTKSNDYGTVSPPSRWSGLKFRKEG